MESVDRGILVIRGTQAAERYFHDNAHAFFFIFIPGLHLAPKLKLQMNGETLLTVIAVITASKCHFVKELALFPQSFPTFETVKSWKAHPTL